MRNPITRYVSVLERPDVEPRAGRTNSPFEVDHRGSLARPPVDGGARRAEGADDYVTAYCDCGAFEDSYPVVRPLLRDLGELNLSIEYMENLTDLRGLEGDRVVRRTLRIRQNPRLTSLAGLEGLERVRGRLNISGNPLLPQSEIDALMARIEVGE